MVFRADQEIGRDLAAVDWASTPLGPVDNWPQSLRTAVDILLSSQFSMWMGWGPELTFFCNAAYRRDTLGRKYPWALGRPASEVWAEIWPDIAQRVERVLSEGEATWDEALMLILGRSGYPEESYHTFSYSPLRDDDARVVGLLCVVSEDTERVIAQRRIATLRDLGSDPSVIRTERQMLDFASGQLNKNPYDLPFSLTYLFGERGDAQLAGVSGIAFGHPAAPETLTGDGDSLWPADKAAQGECEVIELDGVAANLPTGAWPEPPKQAFMVPLLQQGAPPLGFLVAGLNRYRELDDGYRGFVELVAGYLATGVSSARSYQTQQQRAEELAELDRAKTTFFSNISHEFRTPLTLILGPVDELRSRDDSLDETARQELELVHRNGLRLAKLVNTLLDFSRIEAGRMRAQFEPVDLASLTAELASVFRSAINQVGLALTVECPPLDEPVYVDREMWEKVVLNLLSNALKFTFDGGISVRVTQEGGQAVISFADTGVGVSAAEMPRLFERFHRIETSRARSTEGSGIGLALVKELVGLHGGTITADSREGEGTTFTIRLPFGTAHLPADELVDPSAPRTSIGAISEPYVQEALRWLPGESVSTPVSAALPAKGGAAQPRVLVADDNVDMREYLGNLLGASGYQVSGAADGEQALEAIRVQLPDLVISDVMMPKMDGLQLLAALRADQRTAALPVLLLSARAGQEASIEGLLAGADDYLVKPFAAAELLARVRANVELARMRNYHARWRTALVDSLQEAFFVIDEHGSVIEINAAFGEILGYGPEGLPYDPPHAWWPDPELDITARQLVEDEFAKSLDESEGSLTIPVTHRDGHRLWIAVNFNHAHDPDSGRRVMVGTFRDITAEHYAVQSQSALAELNQQLVQADTLTDALQGAAEVLRRVWQARRVLAVTFANGPTERAPRVVCAGEPVEWADLSPELQQQIGSLRETDLLSTVTVDAGVAGIASQHPRGLLAIWVELTEHRRFTREDQTLLAVLAGRLGQGLQRVYQLDEQRETAVALQHAMLGPTSLPQGFAVRYLPASHPLQVGGDWYDVVDLDEDRVALIVGDCVGHGLAAATVMGQLRSACRALLLEQPSPGAVLTALDRFAERLPGARCTTAFCAVLTQETGELVYSSAGHPPPIMVYADGTTVLLGGEHGLPLALRPNWQRPESRITMPPRATLLLYTDGLVERRGHSLDDGMTRAADLVQNGRSQELEEVADRLMSQLEPGGGYPDDVAMLLYRQPAPFSLEFAADANYLADSRDALRSWLTRAGVEPEQIQDVLIAAGEAVANAIEHGHRDQRVGTVSLRATAIVDRLQVTVTDTGAWKTPTQVAEFSRGRGISLMRVLMEDCSIQSSEAGTTVSMHARIT
ncbi:MULTISPECIES: SpoIIE family protein phosphatase [unclassified Mycobacterium]|uniref:SpoIIE family protein phosphatase n=1 Tax=unclassified Mycobacterium TaxID=2642494 RepID=UPI002740E1F2|nr:MULTISPECIES: SpoIIE family protein phosphatase [unclassified Mycobacterium]MDP7703453.1 SpoIIE family protein phosphatase [Mycobacterium sp. TY815]MDP7721936.1 SpoIIE family protein phosphatase [Mycobacterium sp. TY814]